MTELAEEAGIGQDVPVFADSHHCLSQWQPLPDHEVGEDQRSRTTDPSGTVHKHFACRAKRCIEQVQRQQDTCSGFFGELL